jgi:hypothetical protein
VRARERAREEQKSKARAGGREKGSSGAWGKRRKRPACAARLCTGWPRRACCSVPFPSPLLCALPFSALCPPLLPCCQGLKARGDPDSTIPGIALCSCSLFPTVKLLIAECDWNMINFIDFFVISIFECDWNVLDVEL